MSHAKKSAKNRRFGHKQLGMPGIRKQHSIQRNQRTLFAPVIGLTMAIVLVIGLALLVIIGHAGNIASASGGNPGGNVPVGYGSLNHAKGSCGNPGQAACPAINAGWFTVTSESPQTVATAIAHSSQFVTMQGRYSYVTSDTPALVHAFAAHTGNDYYDDDHWVVSVRDAMGMRCGIFDFVYDRVHQRMRFSSYGVLTSLDANSRQAFPYISSSTALARLQIKLKLQPKAGTRPELIFFPIDPNFPVLTSPAHKWSGGGNSPMEPIWHIAASNGQDYFVGSDLGVYTQTNLPVAKGQP
jgi:hypothetical protein